MATDLQDKQEGDTSDRIQADIDRKFSELTHPDHYGQDASEPKSAEDLRQAEESGGLYNPDGDGGSETKSQDSESKSSDADQVGKGYSDSDKSYRSFRKDVKRGFKQRLKDKKWLILAGGGGGGGVIITVLLLLLFASTLKIPNLAQDITTFEFARLTRQYADAAERSTDETLAVESTDEGLHGLLKAKYGSLRDSTWGRMDKYRPAQVQKTLNRTNGLKINEDSTITGRTFVKSIELDGKTYSIEQTGGIAKFVPGLRQYTQFKNNVDFVRNYSPALNEVMADNDVGFIIRGAVDNRIRKEADIGLIAWVVGKYKDKTPAEADLQVNRDDYDKIADKTPETSSSETSAINNAETDAQNATEAAVADDKSLTAAIAEGGVVDAANAAINKDVSSSLLTKSVSYINPAYAFAVPACIIFNGSIDKAGGTIDAQTQEQERAYYTVASAGDQQKQGSEVGDEQGSELATAIGATNDKLGDTTLSNASIRANGGTVDTSATGVSSEASPLGDYTAFNLIPGIGGSGVASTIGNYASKGCSVVTNLYVALSTGVIIQIGSIIGDIFSGGAPSEAEAAAEAATDAVVDTTTDTIVSRLTTGLSEKFASTFSKDGAKQVAVKLRTTLGVKNLTKEGGKIALLTGATILAKLVVMSKAHQNYNGLEQGPDYANEADSGANIQAGEISRSQLFGRPLTNAELADSDTADHQSIMAANGSKSFTDRYFATSNANSLVSHLALDMSGMIKPSILASLTSAGSHALSPLRSIANIFGMLTGRAHALQDPTNEYYGNVQFGFSEAEEKLIQSSASYLPLENQAAFSQELQTMSTTEDAIAKTYAKCFGYDYSQNSVDDTFDPNDTNGHLVLASGAGQDASIGSLLQNMDIVRTASGDIVPDKGTCSPQNLGVNNATYKDLVFRWRLLEQYNTTLDQQTNLQSVST